jgi:hypothetical protein
MDLVGEIGKYAVDFYCGGQKTITQELWWCATIDLYGTTGNWMATISFYHEMANLPEKDTRKPTGEIYGNLLMKDFPVLIDLLRNEKPLYLYYQPAPYDRVMIGSMREPVGEGEPSGIIGRRNP